MITPQVLALVRVREEDRALSHLPLSHLFEATIEVALLSRGASVLYARSLRPGTLLRLPGTQEICMVLVHQVLDLFMKELEREVRQQGKEHAFDLLHHIASAPPFSWRRLLLRRVHQRFGGQFRFFISGGPPPLAAVVDYLGIANLLLGCFHLLPAFPLDGGRVSRSLLKTITSCSENLAPRASPPLCEISVIWARPVVSHL